VAVVILERFFLLFLPPSLLLFLLRWEGRAGGRRTLWGFDLRRRKRGRKGREKRRSDVSMVS